MRAGQGFQVLHGTYGKINSSKDTIDVTAKLRDIAAAQGGRSLMLRPSARDKVRNLRAYTYTYTYIYTYTYTQTYTYNSHWRSSYSARGGLAR